MLLQGSAGTAWKYEGAPVEWDGSESITNTGQYSRYGYYAHIWTATPDGSTTACELFYNDWMNYHSYYQAPRTNGFSVRCVLAE